MVSAPWEQSLFDEVDGNFEHIVSLRRHLHQHPELSGEERETSLMLYQKLGDMGLQVRMGIDGRGVVTDLFRSMPTRVCLRADIDALRIQDEKDVAYRSQCDGVMHACGHDAHSAIVYGALSAIQQVVTIHDLRPSHGIRAIFQPAEETCQGAMDMIEVGALDSVVRIFGLHVDPTRACGTIGVRSGVLTASCDEILFEVHGAGGHAARPHEAVDPIVAAAHLIQVLYKFIPRATDSQDAVVLTVGMIRGGHNSNVIPDKVELGGTLRTLNEEVRHKTLKHIQHLADGVSHISGATIRYRTGMSVPSVRNEGSTGGQLAASAATFLNSDQITQIPRPSMGSEDFAFYLEHVPGAMFRLGCASEQVGDSGLHTPTFDVDDEALRIGSKILAHAALASMME
ncbi:MAG TPA: amidohydrolase [Planctomycetes bacterium]|nr:amidohydrolase [Planctomycetaceae bacterium]HIM28027.1 amidohydrolase [Planctomycetota bacterium]